MDMKSQEERILDSENMQKFIQDKKMKQAIEQGLIEESDLAKLDKPPYNIHLSLLRPEKQKDILQICNLQKFSILAIRMPFLKPLIKLLIKLLIVV